MQRLRIQQIPVFKQFYLQTLSSNEQAMAVALELADWAAYWGEVPVGAVVLDAQGLVIGMGVNQTIYQHDPTQHAEIAALRQACAFVGNYRLPGAQLVVTLEPCMMCMGALLHARLARVVYGATDPKTGVCDSVLHQDQYQKLNHHTEIVGGVLQDQCSQRLKDFFRQRRAARK